MWWPVTVVNQTGAHSLICTLKNFIIPILVVNDCYYWYFYRGPTKPLDSSGGFLSARSFDDNTDRRLKDPYSNSLPGDRWSELRGRGDREAGMYSYPPINLVQNSPVNYERSLAYTGSTLIYNL